MMKRSIATAMLLACAATWAAGVPASMGAETMTEPRELTLEDVVPKALESFHLVLLRRPATAPEVGGAEGERIQIAHLAHLSRLHEEGLTVAHGPFDVPADHPLRGIVLFRGAVPRERVEEVMALDPWVKVGRLEVEVLSWWTAAGRLPGGKPVPPPPAAED